MFAQLMETPESLLLVYVGFALAAFLVVSGIFQLVSRAENRAEARTRRLKIMARGATTEEVLQILKPNRERGLIERLPFFGDVPKMMRQAGIVAPPARFIFVCFALSLAFGTAASIRMPVLQALPAGMVLGVFIPLFVLNTMRNRRMDRLAAQLPDALDLMARGLRVGHPLNTSIAAVAREMPDPIGTEFGIIADQISFGDDLVDAVSEFADRIDLEDVHYLSASIAIQHGTGGDLAKIVDTLAHVMRSRILLRRRVKAISAEGRLTAYFLSAVPFLIFGMNMVTNPDYYWGVRNDPLFIPMMVSIVVLVVLNGVVLNRLVKIRY